MPSNSRTGQVRPAVPTPAAGSPPAAVLDAWITDPAAAVAVAVAPTQPFPIAATPSSTDSEAPPRAARCGGGGSSGGVGSGVLDDGAARASSSGRTQRSSSAARRRSLASLALGSPAPPAAVDSPILGAARMLVPLTTALAAPLAIAPRPEAAGTVAIPTLPAAVAAAAAAAASEGHPSGSDGMCAAMPPLPVRPSSRGVFIRTVPLAERRRLAATAGNEDTAAGTAEPSPGQQQDVEMADGGRPNHAVNRQFGEQAAATTANSAGGRLDADAAALADLSAAIAQERAAWGDASTTSAPWGDIEWVPPRSVPALPLAIRQAVATADGGHGGGAVARSLLAILSATLRQVTSRSLGYLDCSESSSGPPATGPQQHPPQAQPPRASPPHVSPFDEFLAANFPAAIVAAAARAAASIGSPVANPHTEPIPQSSPPAAAALPPALPASSPPPPPDIVFFPAFPLEDGTTRGPPTTRQASPGGGTDVTTRVTDGGGARTSADPLQSPLRPPSSSPPPPPLRWPVSATPPPAAGPPPLFAVAIAPRPTLPPQPSSVPSRSPPPPPLPRIALPRQEARHHVDITAPQRASQHSEAFADAPHGAIHEPAPDDDLVEGLAGISPRQPRVRALIGGVASQVPADESSTAAPASSTDAAGASATASGGRSPPAPTLPTHPSATSLTRAASTVSASSVAAAAASFAAPSVAAALRAAAAPPPEMMVAVSPLPTQSALFHGNGGEGDSERAVRHPAAAATSLPTPSGLIHQSVSVRASLDAATAVTPAPEHQRAPWQAGMPAGLVEQHEPSLPSSAPNPDGGGASGGAGGGGGGGASFYSAPTVGGTFEAIPSQTPCLTPTSTASAATAAPAVPAHAAQRVSPGTGMLPTATVDTHLPSPDAGLSAPFSASFALSHVPVRVRDPAAAQSDAAAAATNAGPVTCSGDVESPVSLASALAAQALETAAVSAAAPASLRSLVCATAPPSAAVTTTGRLEAVPIPSSSGPPQNLSVSNDAVAVPAEASPDTTPSVPTAAPSAVALTSGPAAGPGRRAPTTALVDREDLSILSFASGRTTPRTRPRPTLPRPALQRSHSALPGARASPPHRTAHAIATQAPLTDASSPPPLRLASPGDALAALPVPQPPHGASPRGPPCNRPPTALQSPLPPGPPPLSLPPIQQQAMPPPQQQPHAASSEAPAFVTSTASPAVSAAAPLDSYARASPDSLGFSSAAAGQASSTHEEGMVLAAAETACAGEVARQAGVAVAAELTGEEDEGPTLIEQVGIAPEDDDAGVGCEGAEGGSEAVGPATEGGVPFLRQGAPLDDVKEDEASAGVGASGACTASADALSLHPRPPAYSPPGSPSVRVVAVAPLDADDGAASDSDTKTSGGDESAAERGARPSASPRAVPPLALWQLSGVSRAPAATAEVSDDEDDDVALVVIEPSSLVTGPPPVS